jgi:tRNA dimethylallyltransferase
VTSPDRPQIVAVVGPTAAGKSDLAVSLALALGEHTTPGEVVNGDSMQVYRGMDIGTAKLTPEERRGVAHHVLDMLEVTEPCTVVDFQTWARAAIEDCRRRGVVPVVVGGSALYLRAVLDDLTFPGTDAQVRERLEQELAERGVAALHADLARVDPTSAATILPSNSRRIVRALEVVEITGRPFRASLPAHSYAFPGVVQLGIDVPRDILDVRIEQRVRRMWGAGFVDEVRALRERGLADGRTASRALGYRQVLAYLDGRATEEEAFHETVTRTRRFARRQDSWFRRDPRIQWLPFDAPDLLDRALAAATTTDSSAVLGARRADEPQTNLQ